MDGDLAFELARTLSPRRDGALDRLASPADLAAWLHRQAAVLGPAGAETALRLADFRALRAAVRGVLSAVVESRAVPEDAVARLNAASAAAPSSPGLDLADPGAPVAVERSWAGSRTAEILAAVARSAIAVAGGPDRDRLRRCPAPRCGAFFLSTRPGRRWCSEACGNRARVARHVARRRGGGS